MSLPQGINFRATHAYVTDGANDDSEITGVTNYPRVSDQGNNVGWEDNINGQILDRNSSNNAKLAGIHYAFAGTNLRYRIDLPSTGSYDIRIASGDAGDANEAHVTVKDTTTTLFTIEDSSNAANEFVDAADVKYTAANWVTSNSAVNVTMASTILRFHLSPSSAAGHTVDCLAHVSVDNAAGGGGGSAASLLLLHGNMRGNLGRLAGNFQ